MLVQIMVQRSQKAKEEDTHKFHLYVYTKYQTLKYYLSVMIM